eukprot:scaffold123493_cov25-Tisochrysis_lutea.AAC.1
MQWEALLLTHHPAHQHRESGVLRMCHRSDSSTSKVAPEQRRKVKHTFLRRRRSALAESIQHRRTRAGPQPETTLGNLQPQRAVGGMGCRGSVRSVRGGGSAPKPARALRATLGLGGGGLCSLEPEANYATPSARQPEGSESAQRACGSDVELHMLGQTAQHGAAQPAPRHAPATRQLLLVGAADAPHRTPHSPQKKQKNFILFFEYSYRTRGPAAHGTTTYT